MRINHRYPDRHLAEGVFRGQARGLSRKHQTCIDTGHDTVIFSDERPQIEPGTRVFFRHGISKITCEQVAIDIRPIDPADDV